MSRRVSLFEFATQMKRAQQNWYIWQVLGGRRFGIIFVWARKDGKPYPED